MNIKRTFLITGAIKGIGCAIASRRVILSAEDLSSFAAAKSGLIGFTRV